MPKTRLCIILLFCAVGFFALMSCSQSTNTLRIADDDGGYYPVDVVFHDSVIDKSETPPGVTYYNTYVDATTKITVTYATAYEGWPVYPAPGASALQLTNYTVTWRCNPTSQKIPPTSGGIDEIVKGAPDGSNQISLTLMTIPAITKETCTALLNLVADHSSGVVYNGELSALGTITIYGTDLLTGQQMSAVGYLNAEFADYNDLKTVH
jgi:hypothetical protein